MWTVISKKKMFTLFSNQRATRGFNSFSKSGPSCEIIALPCTRPNPFEPAKGTYMQYQYP